MQSLADFFTDPVLMAPTIGSMLMCLLAAMIGTFAVIKRYALVGEMLSHACYPGVIVGMLVFQDTYLWLPLLGAIVSCVLAMYLTDFMRVRCKIKADAALTFVLASFFGVGLTLLTSVQNSKPALYKKLQSYLFGQAATMTNEHVWMYAGLTVGVLIILFFFYRLLTVSIFDPEFTKVSGMNQAFAEWLLVALIVVATVIGIRSVGVVLMSSMLIFPAVSARFWTVNIVPMLILAACFGLVFGFLGIYFSHSYSIVYATSFATGPSIVLVASCIFFLSALFSKERGILVRVYRRIGFWYRCQQENLLKAIWKQCDTGRITVKEIQDIFHESRALVCLLLFMLKKNGRVRKVDVQTYELTASGLLWARKIVRLHRLWEAYLVSWCGISKERVHPSAEQMEHILTPELERELESVLGYPEKDPHEQPIPAHEEVKI